MTLEGVYEYIYNQLVLRMSSVEAAHLTNQIIIRVNEAINKESE